MSHLETSKLDEIASYIKFLKEAAEGDEKALENEEMTDVQYYELRGSSQQKRRVILHLENVLNRTS